MMVLSGPVPMLVPVCGPTTATEGFEDLHADRIAKNLPTAARREPDTRRHLAPSGGSHRLTTRATPALAASFHGATVVDAATPRATSGAPLFEGVWGYLAIP